MGEAGWNAAALGQFNTMVSTAKDPLCTAIGTCANHTLCTSGLESSSTSSARSVSMSWLLLTFVAFSLLFLGDACDAQGMAQCNTEYLSSVPGATGNQACDVVNNLVTCINSKGAGCNAAALGQFNTMVSTAKDPLCTATGACANHTLCSSAGSGSSSSTSFAWAAPASLLTIACMYFGATQ